jgi:hypothetical protein
MVGVDAHSTEDFEAIPQSVRDTFEHSPDEVSAVVTRGKTYESAAYCRVGMRSTFSIEIGCKQKAPRARGGYLGLAEEFFEVWSCAESIP